MMNLEQTLSGSLKQHLQMTARCALHDYIDETTIDSYNVDLCVLEAIKSPYSQSCKHALRPFMSSLQSRDVGQDEQQDHASIFAVTRVDIHFEAAT